MNVTLSKPNKSHKSPSPFRTFIRRIMLDLLSFGKKPNSGIHILNGHFLSLNEAYTSGIFKKQLMNLSQSGVRFIDFEVACDRIVHQKLPEKECLVAFSFDDGFEECFTKIKPVLDEFGIKAAFFINPAFIDGDENYQKKFREEVVFTDKPPMLWQQIKILHAEGHTIGAHTIDHLHLATAANSEIEYQIGECKKLLDTTLNFDCRHFAFPYGKIIDIRENGVAIAKKYFRYVYSQDNYTHYFSFNGEVINRRHFECDWPWRHVVFFLKKKVK